MLDPVAYPNLLQEGCVKTSDKDPGYNCIAHAAGDDEKWWWPKSGKLGYWPKGVTNKVTLGAFVQAFRSLGYEICNDPELEGGYEKIAIYWSRRKPTHAARQLPDGRWTHKVGKNIDLTSTLRGLEGPDYGKVTRIMRRPIDP